MLDQLFGSKTRVSLLKLFLDNPDQVYFVRELTRVVGAQINSVRRELDTLVHIGLVKVIEDAPEKKLTVVRDDTPKGLNKKKYYQLNASSPLYHEFAALFAKSHLVLEKEMMHELRALPNVQYLVLTGFFTNQTQSLTDMLLVGPVDRPHISTIIGQFEKRLGREINYTVMTAKEFEYRRQLTDKFLYDIFVNPKIVVIDQLGVNQ